VAYGWNEKDLKKSHPHTWDQKQAAADLGTPPPTPTIPKIGQAGGITGQNNQAAGVGVSTYTQFAGPYGKVHGPSNPTNLKHYDYSGKSDAVNNLLQQHKYNVYYAGGKYFEVDRRIVNGSSYSYGRRRNV
jgi:hypothetical protein